MAELVGGAVVGAVVGELLKVVLDAKETASNFRPILIRIEDTLQAIVPRLDEISRLNHKLNLQQKEMVELVSLINNGKALVLKCSKISNFNLVKKVQYSKELLHLDNTLLRYFMTILPLDLFRDNKEILVMVRELHVKLASDKDEAVSNNQSELGKPRKDSGSGSHEAGKLHQVSKMVKDVKLYNECQMELHVKLEDNKDGGISNKSESVRKKENSRSGVKEARTKLYQGSEKGEARKLYQDPIKEEAPEFYEDLKKEEPLKLYQDSINDEPVELYLDSEKEEALNLYQDSKNERAAVWWYYKSNKVEVEQRKYVEIEQSGQNYKKEVGKLFLLEDFPYDLDIEDLRSLLVKKDLSSEFEVLCNGTFGTSYRYRKMSFVLPLIIKKLNEVKVGEREFKQQIEYLGKVGWLPPHVVFPKGYYFSAEGKLLIYDVTVAGNLFQRLHDNRYEDIPFGRSKYSRFSTDHGLHRIPLHWKARVKITLGIAKGIYYLHSFKLIHGNIESSNVLVTCQDHVFIWDYGLDPIMNLSATSQHSGYCAPELNETGEATQKSDVYSFGIMLLEILCRRRPDECDLLSYAYEYMRDRKFFNFDWELSYRKYKEEMEEMLGIAIQCVEKEPNKRPQLDDVVRMIEKIQTMSPEPSDYFWDY